MRTLFCAVCFFAVISGCCFADDFVPSEEKDPPVLNENIESDYLIPLGVTSIGITAAGLTMTAIGFYNIFSNIEYGFETPQLQAGIIMVAGGGILTAVAAVIIDFILQE